MNTGLGEVSACFHAFMLSTSYHTIILTESPGEMGPSMESALLGYSKFWPLAEEKPSTLCCISTGSQPSVYDALEAPESGTL